MNFFSWPSRAIALGSILPAFFSSLGAQPVVALEEVVITATRTPTPIIDQLSDITLISRRQIEQSGAVSLPQLLSQLPGLQITPDSVRGASATLFIRGANSNHALFLIDGQRVSSATVGTTAIAQLPLEQIERIEVLRGPASSLYGADALGGVIQIFTRQGERAPAAQATVTVGSYGSRAVSASYGGKVNDTRFRVSLGREVTAGFSDIRAPKGGYYDSFNPDRDGYAQSNWALSLAQRVAPDWELGASYWVSQGTKRSDNANCDPNDWVGTSCTTAFDNRETQRLESWQIRAQYRPSAAWTSALRLGRSRDDQRSWQFNPGPPEVTVPRYTTTQQQVAWQNDVRVGSGVLMSAFERRRSAIDSTQTFTVRQQDSDSLVLGYQAWLDRHLLQVSWRKDWVQALPDQTTHSLGYGFRFAPHWLVRAAVGTGYKVPTFNDLYWPLDRASMYEGNPQLRPEQSRNVELALSHQFQDTLFNATIYRNQVTDLIVNTYDPVAGLVRPVNVNAAVLRGLSLQASRRWANWTIKGALDFIDTEESATGLKLPRRVPRQATIEALRQLGAWSYGTQLWLYSHRYNDKQNTQRLAGYGLLNFNLGYDLSPQLRLQARFTNVLDKTYVQAQGLYAPFNEYATAGRSVFVTLRYAPKP
jgi:vitamin B12 transporter